MNLKSCPYDSWPLLAPETGTQYMANSENYSNTEVALSLVPRPPPFFVLQFAFKLIHRSEGA